MADILTLEQARDALGWPAGSHAADEADLSADYIPAVTEILAADHTIPDVVPRTVVIVAKRLIARLWNADHQGTGGERPGGTPAAPAQLTDEDLRMMAPYRTMGGFA